MDAKEFNSLTLRELASISGIDKARWSKYFTGKISVTERTLSRIAPRFNMSSEELFAAMYQRKKKFLSKKTT